MKDIVANLAVGAPNDVVTDFAVSVAGSAPPWTLPTLMAH
jgi:hypothetical protein